MTKKQILAKEVSSYTVSRWYAFGDISIDEIEEKAKSLYSYLVRNNNTKDLAKKLESEKKWVA